MTPSRKQYVWTTAGDVVLGVQKPPSLLVNAASLLCCQRLSPARCNTQDTAMLCIYLVGAQQKNDVDVKRQKQQRSDDQRHDPSPGLCVNEESIEKEKKRKNVLSNAQYCASATRLDEVVSSCLPIFFASSSQGRSTVHTGIRLVLSGGLFYFSFALFVPHERRPDIRQVHRWVPDTSAWQICMQRSAVDANHRHPWRHEGIYMRACSLGLVDLTTTDQSMASQAATPSLQLVRSSDLWNARRGQSDGGR